MKASFLTLIFLSIFTISTFISCEQESLQTPISTLENSIESRNFLLGSSDDPVQIRPGVVLANGRLNFTDEATFESFVQSLETIELIESFLESLKTYNYQSLYYTTGIVMDGERSDIPELEAVLNQHSAIVINNFLIKLNYPQQEAYIIPNTASVLAIYRTETAEKASTLPSEAIVYDFDSDQSIWDIIN